MAPAPIDPAAPTLCVLAGGTAVRLPLRRVREVLVPPPLTRLPHASPLLLGLASLRGHVLPVASLRRLLDAGRDPDRAEPLPGTLPGTPFDRPPDAPDPAAAAPAGRAAGTANGWPAAPGLEPPGTEGPPSDPHRPNPGAEAEAGTRRARIVVVDHGAQRVGLLVEAVLPAGPVAARPIDPSALLPRSFAPEARNEGRTVAPPPATDGPVAANRVALLLFRVAQQEFALPLLAVESVMARARAAGDTADWRGCRLPVVRAALLLGLDDGASVEPGSLLVVRNGDGLAALAVDAVQGVLRVAPERVEPVPPLLRGSTGRARLAGLCRLENGRLVQVLDRDRLLSGAELVPAPPPVDDAAPPTPDRRVLLLQRGARRFALPLACVRAVVRHPGRLTRLPGAPDSVDGVMALRGAVLPVIDPAARFGAAVTTGERRIVVVTANGLSFGLAVDAATRLAAVAPAVGEAGGAISADAPSAGAEAEEAPLPLDPAALVFELARDLRAVAA